MPLFSIITVTLNPRAEDLLKTLHSVLAQDFDDWELLVKDGGSTDDSISQLPEDPRIRFVQQKDAGIFDAMNQAIQQVTGKFVCLLNTGDYFIDKYALSTVADIHFQHSDAIFLYGNVHKPFSRSGYEIYPARLTRFYLFKHMICHQAWFVRRTYYAAGKTYENLHPSGSDYRFLLRILLKDKVSHQHVPKVLVNYQGGGISQRPEIIKQADMWVDAYRRELFSGLEYFFCSSAWRIRDVLKALFYDRFLYKYWRKIQIKRTSG